MAFKSCKVEFCGKTRKFQRCANKELKDYQKTIEDIQNEIYPLTEKTRNVQFEINELEEQIDSIDKSIDLLDKLEDPADDEIREAMKLVASKNSLQRELHDKRKEYDDMQLGDREALESIDEKLRNSYAEFASKIFEDFATSEFHDNYDNTDLTIAPRLSELYRLATSGASQKDVDRAYSNIIKDSFRN